MITSVHYRPKQYTGAYNPIVWSFTSNLVDNLDFNYVVDVYVNAATGATASTYRLKQRPNQQGACMVDVSSIVQPFIDLSLYSAEEGWSKDYRNANEIVATVFLKVGEEFLPNANATAKVIQNGLGVTGAAPAYLLTAATGPGVPTTGPSVVLPSALTYEDSMQNMVDSSFYGYYSNYILGITGSNNASGQRKFLSKFPNNGWDSPNIIANNQHHTVTFLNRNDYLDSAGFSWAASVQGFFVEEYNSKLEFITSNFYYNNTTNGGGPQTSDSYTTTSDIRQDRMLTFACGTADLTLNPATVYYRIYTTFKLSNSGSTTPGAQGSEYVYFKIASNCQDLYPVVRLSWLNDLGGRDYYNFDMFYELTSRSPGAEYNQTPLNWNSLTPVSLDPATQYLNWQRGGAKSINKVVNRSFKIESNWVDQETLDFLGGVAESPSVWAYIGDEPTPYTLMIDNVTYTYKNIKQTKLTQVSYECKITKTQQKQNL